MVYTTKKQIVFSYALSPLYNDMNNLWGTLYTLRVQTFVWNEMVLLCKRTEHIMLEIIEEAVLHKQY